jgi:methyltransferase family protein
VTRAFGFQDLFSRDSAGYAKFRPRYPVALFDWLAGLPAARRIAWDCATGSGQAATLLAERFDLVVGSDASVAQLLVASRAPRVGYFASLAESSALAAGRVDLVTVAQALHWLELPRFYAEVDRVTAPGAALAIWGYATLTAAPRIQAAIRRFHDETVGPYWPTERKLVETGYRSFQIPIREVVAPRFAIEARLTLSALLGYLRTWSAVGNYLSAKGHDPVTALEPELAAAWGDPTVPQPIVWPLFVRAGRWR